MHVAQMPIDSFPGCALLLTGKFSCTVDESALPSGSTTIELSQLEPDQQKFQVLKG